MDNLLIKVDNLIMNSSNILNELKPIVKAICKGYIRESNGLIPLKGIENVCNTVFVEQKENDSQFSGENKILGQTTTDYDENCNIIHKMDYINDNNYIKLITILTHELGHVITEYEPKVIIKSREGINIYPFVKRTNTFYQNCFYDNGELNTKAMYGFRMSDGFLEAICSKIWDSSFFRSELESYGFDLQDYVYKDERLFPSRIYDEYKACFILFDYIMNGKLFEFSCRDFSSNEELIDFINKNKINIIFDCLDKSNDALWELKKYEGKEADEEFIKKLNEYKTNKEMSLSLSRLLMEMYEKNIDDPEYVRLYNNYKSILLKQNSLPIPDESGIKLV